MLGIRKATWNFLLEGMTLILLLAMIATGLSMEFRLPPGSGGREAGGGLTQWGLTRHEWGTVHFYLSLGFIALILIHLWMHWRWIWGLARGSDPARRGVRMTAFAGATAAILLMAGLPWLIPVQQGTGGGNGAGTGDGYRGGGYATETAAALDPASVGPSGAEGTIWLRGRTTFGELAEATGLTVEQLAERIGLSPVPPPEERVGRTLNGAGIEMNAARRALGLPEETEPGA